MFEVTVNTRRAVVGAKELITTSSAGIQVQFTFSEDWDELAKFAIFRNSDEGQEVAVALPNSNLTVIPAQSCSEDYVDEPLFVGVYGTDGLGAVIIPTIWTSLGVLRPGAVTTDIITPPEPTPDMWAQILAIANEAAAIADECEANEELRVAVEQLRADAETARANAETLRVAAEASRAENENERRGAETQRQDAEDARAQAEALRVQAEELRQANETSRVSAENDRVSAEQTRQSQETTRASNEAARVAAEQLRAQKEAARNTAEEIRSGRETARYNNEFDRMAAETQRSRAEEARATAEADRVTAENNRVSAEQSRVNAEADRVTAETNRATEFATWESTIASKVPNTRTINGKALSADITLDSGDIAYDDSETYQSGTAGAALNDLNRQISDVEENQIPELKNDVNSYDKYVIGKEDLALNIDWTNNAYLNDSGEVTPFEFFRYSDLIPINEGKAIIYITNGATTNPTRIHGYNSVGEWVSMLAKENIGPYGPETADTIKTIQFQIPSGISYIKISEKYDKKIIAIVNNDSVCENIEKLRTDFNSIEPFTNIDFTDPVTGKYIAYDGSVNSAEGWNVSKPFMLKTGNVVDVNCAGYNTNASIISKFENNSYTPLVISRSSTVENYKYTATEDMYICICYRATVSYDGVIITTFPHVEHEIETIIKDVYGYTTFSEVDFDDSVSGKYIGYDGSIESVASFSYTQPFAVPKGSTVTAICSGYSTNVSIISQYVSGRYIPLVVSRSADVETYQYVTTEDIQVVICYRNTVNYSGSVETTVIGIKENVDELKEEVSRISGYDYTRILKNMAGIGDSLMSGEIYDDNASQYADCYNSSWLAFLSKFNSAKWACYSNGGLTTKSWLESHWKTDFEALTDLPDSVFIALGSNDKNQQETLPKGSVTDQAGTETFCGLYKQIISVVHTKCPNAKIYCCSLYGKASTVSVEYSEIISDLADLYDYCYFIDIANNITISTLATDAFAENYHFSTLGYYVVADLIHNLLLDSINENLIDYKYFGLYNR